MYGGTACSSFLSIHIDGTGAALLNDRNGMPFLFAQSLAGVSLVGSRVLYLVVPVDVARLVDERCVLVGSVTHGPCPAVTAQRVAHGYVDIERDGIITRELTQHSACHLGSQVQVALVVTCREDAVTVFEGDKRG